MSAAQRVLLALAIVAVDVVVFAVPLTAIAVAYVIVARPRWLLRWVIRLYEDAARA